MTCGKKAFIVCSGITGTTQTDIDSIFETREDAQWYVDENNKREIEAKSNWRFYILTRTLYSKDEMNRGS